MLKAVKSTIFFLIPPLLLWVIAFCHFQTNKQHLYPQLYATDQVIANAPDTFPYLIAGHSRLLRAIDTSLWPEVVKVGTPGESFIETYYKLKYIFEKEKKSPEFVLLPFEIGTFKPNDFRRSFYWKKYLNFFEVATQKGELAEYIKVCLLAHGFPFRHYYGQQIKSWLKPRDIAPNANKTKQSFADYSEAVRRQMIEEDIALLEVIGMMDPSAAYYLAKTLELCQQHQSKLIYIKCPLTETYKKELEKLAIQQNYPEQKLIQIIEKDKNARLIDLQIDFDNQDHYFFDQHHLNKDGAKAFTQLLQQWLY